MHITDLHVERFGIWQDLTLPLGGPGLNVLYGPNEAGKSTLMRFVKAVLYGGVPPRADSGALGDHQSIAGGALRLVHDGKPYTIRRQFTASGGGRLQVIGPTDAPLAADKLGELLCNTSETVFDRVFAVDLFELQELATLDHAELAGHVYGLSLDGRGRRLLAAVDGLRQRRQAMLSNDGRSGRLGKFLDQEQSLLIELRSLADRPSAHADLLRQREEITGQATSLKRRRDVLRDEIRGRRFLDRVYPAWKQVRDYQSELAQYGIVADLPADGVAQLAALEQESEALTGRRDEKKRQSEESKRRAAACGADPEIVKAELAVRAMLGLRGWVEETSKARQNAADAKTKTADVAQQARGALSTEWNGRKLDGVDTSPAAQLALSAAARTYRLTLGRRSVLRKEYRRLHQANAKREALVEQRLERIGASPDVAAGELRRRLSSLESLAALRAKEAALDQRGSGLRNRLERLVDSLEIPPWVSFVLAVFALGGAFFAVLGFITGFTIGVIAGAAYLLLGLTCGIIAVRMRTHYDVALTETVNRIRDERQAEEVELRKVREEIARLEGATGPAPAAKPPVRENANVIPLASAGRTTAPASVADALRDAVKEFAALDEIVGDQDRIRRRRKQLSQMRARLVKVQQDADAARQEWCRTLTRVGLVESLDVDAALAQWQTLAEAAAARDPVGSAEREHEILDRTLRSFGAQLEAMGRRIKVWSGDANRPLDALELWERELDAALRKSAERRKHLEEAERAQQDMLDAEERLKDSSRQRTALLAAAGVTSRADYERRLTAAEQRRGLRELLGLAESELATLAAGEPELAIVEDDLRAFRTDENAQSLGRLSRELETLEATLEATHERRGNIARRIDELESDDRSLAVRRRKAKLGGTLQKMTERHLALSLAEQAAEHARAAYERDRQPPVLAAASESLARLTRNRYVRIWAPLGERSLRVDDDHGRTFTVEQLSGGTREQLFLALRLGLVRRAAEQGVSLPLILDDVFVNFDQLRTEAAFETLSEFAAEGRQVLFFTCHLHLAHLAEHRGIDPIWLPGHQPPMQQRLAG
ncbi:MAG: AAA family ATPase [Planctomycetaceae bacterium]